MTEPPAWDRDEIWTVNSCIWTFDGI